MAVSKPKRGRDDEAKPGSNRFFREASEDSAYVGFIRVTEDMSKAFGDLAQISSIAGIGMMYGFNRSGGITIAVYCEGDQEKAYYTSDEHFLATWAELYNSIFDYCESKQPKRFAKAEVLELLEGHKG